MAGALFSDMGEFTDEGLEMKTVAFE